MNFQEISEEKARELLREYAKDLSMLTPQAIATLAFMRGMVYAYVDIDKQIDKKAAAKAALSARLTVGGSPS